MIVLVLSGILVLALGGCACVWWASHGDAPRWARVVAAVTLAAGEFLTQAATKTRKSTQPTQDD